MIRFEKFFTTIVLTSGFLLSFGSVHAQPLDNSNLVEGQESTSEAQELAGDRDSSQPEPMESAYSAPTPEIVQELMEEDEGSSGRRRTSRSNSLITLGIGAELGLSRHAPISSDRQNDFVSEVSARIRLFRILGVAFSYNLMRADDSGVLSFTSKFRLTGIFYLIPTERASVYIAGGLGARNIQDVISLTGETTSYHAGIGLEVYVGRRLAFHVDYFWLIPGVTSVRNAIDEQTETVYAAIESAVDEGSLDAMPDSIPDMSFSDFLDAGNFQLIFGVRCYL